MDDKSTSLTPVYVRCPELHASSVLISSVLVGSVVSVARGPSPPAAFLSHPLSSTFVALSGRLVSLLIFFPFLHCCMERQLEVEKESRECTSPVSVC